MECTRCGSEMEDGKKRSSCDNHVGGGALSSLPGITPLLQYTPLPLRDCVIYDNYVTFDTDSFLYRFCRLLPPAIKGKKIALCGMGPTVLGIVPPHAAFRPFTCRLNTSIASIKARQTPPQRTTHFLFSFSLSCLPRPVHCPLSRIKILCYPTITLFQYGVVWSFQGG